MNSKSVAKLREILVKLAESTGKEKENITHHLLKTLRKENSKELAEYAFEHFRQIEGVTVAVKRYEPDDLLWNFVTELTIDEYKDYTIVRKNNLPVLLKSVTLNSSPAFHSEVMQQYFFRSFEYLINHPSIQSFHASCSVEYSGDISDSLTQFVGYGVTLNLPDYKNLESVEVDRIGGNIAESRLIYLKAREGAVQNPSLRYPDTLESLNLNTVCLSTFPFYLPKSLKSLNVGYTLITEIRMNKIPGNLEKFVYPPGAITEEEHMKLSQKIKEIYASGR